MQTQQFLDRLKQGSNSISLMPLFFQSYNGKLMSINGLRSRSPLANNALYSAECSNGTFLNLYES